MWDIGTRFMRWGHSATRSDKNDTVWESLVPYPLLSFYFTLAGWPLWSFVNKLTPQLCVITIRCLLPGSETPTGELMPPTHKGTFLQNTLCAKQPFGGIFISTPWSISFSWRWFCYVMQIVIKLMFLLPHPPECWNLLCVLPLLASAILLHFVFIWQNAIDHRRSTAASVLYTCVGWRACCLPNVKPSILWG